MPYICKAENVAGLTDAINNKIQSYIKYKIVKGNLESNNWFALALSGSRYQVVSVTAVETPENTAYIFLPYRAYNGNWHVRVFNASDMNPVTGVVIDAIVCYIDLGTAVDTSDVTVG